MIKYQVEQRFVEKYGRIWGVTSYEEHKFYPYSSTSDGRKFTQDWLLNRFVDVKTWESFALSETKLIPFSGIKETAVLPTKTTQGKENMEPYSFISSESEIDFIRIVREANNHPFIQVDIQDRRGRSTDDIYFFVHNDILKNKDLRGVTLIDRPLEPEWGGNDLKGQVLFSYRSINGCKKDISIFKDHVAHIKALLSSKNRKTFVTLL